MEFNLKKVSVGSPVTLLDTVAEQPVDIDFTLPDYCPDIEKILRCKISPKIYNRSLSGGQLQLDGTAVVSVLYTSSDKSAVRVCEQTVPFNASFPVKECPEDYSVSVSARCEYVNCRALSKRRLSIHGAFSLYADIIGKGSLSLYSPCDAENVEFNSIDTEISELTAVCGECFNISDDIYIKGKPPVELILDSEVSANITETKQIPDKLMLGGELNVKILYLSDIENSSINQVDCAIPFSQVVDCAGVREDTELCVGLNVMSCDVRLKSDILSENPLVSVEAKLSVNALGYSNLNIPVVLDAFSTEYFSELEKSVVNIPTKYSVLSDVFMHKSTVSLGESSIGEIVDFRAKYCPQAPLINGNTVNLSGKLTVCILAYDDNHELVYLERSADINYPIELSENYNTVNSFNSSIVSVSYRIGEKNDIELRAEMKYCITLSEITPKSIVSAVKLSEDNPLPDKKTALILYYAETGEKVWDIAKCYGTSVKSLYEENNLGGEVLDEPVMLLIPTV